MPWQKQKPVQFACKSILLVANNPSLPRLCNYRIIHPEKSVPRLNLAKIRIVYKVGANYTLSCGLTLRLIIRSASVVATIKLVCTSLVIAGYLLSNSLALAEICNIPENVLMRSRYRII